ncbi:MAG: hypothetical protein JO044_17825 [Mycobacteriaceae bacterium]|nr:hypothetical protein [Mycobacteriaceae bacterium]
MLIAAVLCLCGAVLSAVFGVRALARPAPAIGAQQVLRAVAPTQLAAAVMLSAGGLVALSARSSPVLVVLCVLGAVGTVAAGIWQGGRHTLPAARRERLVCSRQGQQACAICTLSCSG